MTMELHSQLGINAALALALFILFHYISKLAQGTRGVFAWGLGYFIYSIGTILIDTADSLAASFHLQNYLGCGYIAGTLLASLGLTILTYAVISFTNARKPRKKEYFVFAIMVLAVPFIWLNGVNYDTSGAIISANKIFFLLFLAFHFKRFKQPPFELPAKVIVYASIPLLYFYTKAFLASLDKGYSSNLEWGHFDLAIWFLFNFCMLLIASFKAAESFRKQSLVDTLTGALNRHGFRERISSLGLEQNNEQSIAALTIDIDHFKSFNDTYDHAKGDELLREVGATIKSSLTHGELFARNGNEEFIILIRNKSLEEVKTLAEKLRIQVANLNQTNSNIPRKVTLSAGVSFTEEPMSISTLIQQSFQALYRAKNSGRNQVVYANDDSYLGEPIEFTLS